MPLCLTTPFTIPTSQQKLRLLPHPNPARSSINKTSTCISCNQNQVPNPENLSFDRRNVLIGLGTLYGASPLLGNTALADPIQPPDLEACHLAYDPMLKQNVKCCKPDASKATPFQFPPKSDPMRMRRNAHNVDEAYLAKFKLAIQKMKDLPEDDPRNFFNQAQIHCAFCDEAYDQVGYPNIPLQVHGSWIFPAWHRFYVYFWEKILGNLINDPTFAIPYWSWDGPETMKLPKFYLDEKSPLYNPNRNLDHYDAVLDYSYSSTSTNPTPAEIPGVIQANLRKLNYDYIESKKCPVLFMGRTLSAGEPLTQQPGYLESTHNTIHQWVGPTTNPHWDMGNLHTAARDCIFFGLHANVDRLWNVYQKYRNNVPEFDSKDWLDASFVFPDPDAKGGVLRCSVRQSLDPSLFRYTYESVDPKDQPFLNIGRANYLKQKKSAAKPRSLAEPLVTVSEFGTKSRELTSTIRALVKRPKTFRSTSEKEKASEVLLVDEIDYKDEDHVRFDVYIAKPTADGKVTSDLGELAGSYVKIPDTHGKKLKNTKRFGITTLLEDIEADASDNLVVSLVPRVGEVTIGGLDVELLPSS